MAITGPPTIGKSFPRKYAGTAMTKERRIHFQFLIIKFIYVPLSLNYSSNFIKLVEFRFKGLITKKHGYRRNLCRITA